MTKHEFRNLFLKALKSATRVADERLGKRIPRSFLIELHAPTSTGEVMTVDQATDRIYLGPDTFYRIIDIAIQKVLPHQTVVFVRASGHAPSSFDETWEPTRFGPFKQILAQTIEDEGISA